MVNELMFCMEWVTLEFLWLGICGCETGGFQTTNLRCANHNLRIRDRSGQRGKMEKKVEKIRMKDVENPTERCTKKNHS